MNRKSVSAKITPPKPSGAVQRQRLFHLLDAKMDKAVVWVSSPAGSGKTTLVSSYLDSRKLPCIWYQCDEGDSDLATFFYYMGLAARKASPRSKKSLPLLTSGYLSCVPAFTRKYFESLYSRLATSASLKNRPMPPSTQGAEVGFTIVLDNYQDVPADSPFQDMTANGFDMIPEGVHMVVLSRSDPPAAMARLRANDKINLIAYRDIRFTLEESKGLVHGRIPKLDNEYFEEIYVKTEGWAAGIVLMLESARLEGSGMDSAGDAAYDKVFDYFAGEIFNKTEKEVQNFLLKTAFLPTLSVSLAENLTGSGNAGSILSALYRQHYFTERLSGSGQVYRYHPLFRDFLLNRVKTKFPSDDLAAIRTRAAALLEQSGETENAARLYIDAEDERSLARMVIRHSRELLMQGRNKTVEEWIAEIPGEIADDHPWLLYWTGMCSFPMDMPRARKFLQRAFESFKVMSDTPGIYLSWAGVVDTYAFELDEWKHLDNCITVLDGLRKTNRFPSKEIDLIVSSRMLISLTLRKTDRPERVHGWLDRVSALLQENPSVDIQMDTLFCMSVYYLWKGEYNKNVILLERAEAEIRYRRPSPFAVIRMKLMRGIHLWVTAQYDAALNALSEGLAISEKSGAHVFDSLLWCFRAAAEMARGNLEIAEQSLKNQMTSLLKMPKTLDIFFYHINSAWYAILRGDTSLAAENLDAVSAKVAKMGTPYYRALWSIGMAHVAFSQDSTDDARKHILTAHRISLRMKSHVLEWSSLLIEAYFLFKESRAMEGVLSLRRGLSLGKRHGYVHLEFYQPLVMQFLYAKALENGIEQEYVKGLIRKLGLFLPQPLALGTAALFLEEWPYPIKIFTLGRFEIIKDDEPLVFAGKIQKKPLEMLKALIAFGGKNVSEAHLNDALWPEADGDLAHKSFEMTLSRLRLLLGGEKLIKHSAGQLSIDPVCCLVDSIALARISEEIRRAPADLVAQLCEKAVRLYQGPFLPSEAHREWAVSRREMLKNSMLPVILKAGRHYEQIGRWEKAVEYYMKGLDADHLAEVFYQRLMISHGKLGNKADAVKTYNRCRSLLLDELGIEPSTETEVIYSSILQNQ
jgi:ATP/maltotriose-dependent transcriptional regulator MalT/DNA-binding SARP family transcriptional activator